MAQGSKFSAVQSNIVPLDRVESPIYGNLGTDPTYVWKSESDLDGLGADNLQTPPLDEKNGLKRHQTIEADGQCRFIQMPSCRNAKGGFCLQSRNILEQCRAVERNCCSPR